ncbi:MAG TPA: hypothetical protein VN176_09380 [Verrucomicrobiae bacterium]|nr:hypothetical protein [Verrucomicrobiae bacterium]
MRPRVAAWMLMALFLPMLGLAQRGPKRPPQAKSQQEYAAYNTGRAATGGTSLEAAASDFAVKYPESELRLYLYSKAMHAYQSENNPAKMLAMGERVLALDPDNSVALALTATVLADGLNETDPDRAQKAAQIKQDGTRALKTLDSDLVFAPGVTPEEISAYKALLKVMVHSALGIMELKTGNDSGAEKELKAAAGLNATGDPSVYYHLALAQDHQKKYAQALASVEQALQLASFSPDLQQLAESEHERLQKLARREPPR